MMVGASIATPSTAAFGVEPTLSETQLLDLCVNVASDPQRSQLASAHRDRGQVIPCAQAGRWLVIVPETDLGFDTTTSELQLAAVLGGSAMYPEVFYSSRGLPLSSAALDELRIASGDQGY
jgi:hypothetical protein